MVLGKLPVPRRPTIWSTVGQGPTALGVVWTFLLSSILSPSLSERRPDIDHSVYSILTFCEKKQKKKTAGYVIYRCLQTHVRLDISFIFFLLYAYDLWQNSGCSFSVKSYTYLHAIVWFILY